MFNLFSKKKKLVPQHIAIAGSGSKQYAERHGLTFEQASAIKLNNIKEYVTICSEEGVKELTIYLLPLEAENSQLFSVLMDSFVAFFKMLEDQEVRVNVIGKWYDLPGRVIEPMKTAIEKTQNKEGLKLTLCVNYDGQQEIADAAQLLARQVKAGKLDPEAITKDALKGNLYSSSSVPLDLVVRLGTLKMSSLLLWHLPQAKVFATKKSWQEFTGRDLRDAIAWWQQW